MGTRILNGCVDPECHAACNDDCCCGLLRSTGRIGYEITTGYTTRDVNYTCCGELRLGVFIYWKLGAAPIPPTIEGCVGECPTDITLDDRTMPDCLQTAFDAHGGFKEVRVGENGCTSDFVSSALTDVVCFDSPPLEQVVQHVALECPSSSSCSSQTLHKVCQGGSKSWIDPNESSSSSSSSDSCPQTRFDVDQIVPGTFYCIQFVAMDNTVVQACNICVSGEEDCKACGCDSSSSSGSSDSSGSSSSTSSDSSGSGDGDGSSSSSSGSTDSSGSSSSSSSSDTPPPPTGGSSGSSSSSAATFAPQAPLYITTDSIFRLKGNNQWDDPAGLTNAQVLARTLGT